MNATVLYCDSCDRPAVSFARDVRRVDSPEAQFEAYAPSVRLNAGCTDHPAVSREIDPTFLVYRVYSS
jgi:hypothetical protein